MSGYASGQRKRSMKNKQYKYKRECLLTGETFETNHPNRKYHPLVSEFLNTAFTENQTMKGTYKRAKENMLKAAGRTVEEKVLMAKSMPR